MKNKNNSKLTQILKRDENGKPMLNLIPLHYTAVNPQTQEEYWTLMRVYERGGWRWSGTGKFPTELNYWKRFKENFCVGAGISYSGEKKKFGYDNKEQDKAKRWGILLPKEFYKDQKEDLNVISPKKFYKIEKITPEILEEVNVSFDQY